MTWTVIMLGNYQQLINRLKSFRISIWLSQQDMVLRTGLSLRTIINIESGKNVSLQNFMKYIDGLGLTQEFINFPPIADMRFEDMPKNKYERKRVRKEAKYKNVVWGEDKK